MQINGIGKSNEEIRTSSVCDLFGVLERIYTSSELRQRKLAIDFTGAERGERNTIRAKEETTTACEKKTIRKTDPRRDKPRHDPRHWWKNHMYRK
jgi:hypothetical protein